MKRNILTECKKIVVICKESGHVSLSYNVLLITPEDNTTFKLVVLTITVKSTLTYTNCGKIGHSMETYHNRKKEVPIVPTTIITSIKPIAGTKTQPVK